MQQKDAKTQSFISYAKVKQIKCNDRLVILH